MREYELVRWSDRSSVMDKEEHRGVGGAVDIDRTWNLRRKVMDEYSGREKGEDEGYWADLLTVNRTLQLEVRYGRNDLAQAVSLTEDVDGWSRL